MLMLDDVERDAVDDVIHGLVLSVVIHEFSLWVNQVDNYGVVDLK